MTERRPKELDRGKVRVWERWASALVRAGLADFESLYAAKGATVVREKSAKGRTILRLTAGDGPDAQVFFVKRHLPQSWIVRLWKRLTPGGVCGEARREWETIHRLSELGIPTMNPVALGEDPSTGRAALVTEEVPGEPLDGLLKRGGVKEPGTRHELVCALGQLVGRLHEAGFVHRDLYLCHVFGRVTPAGGWDLRLIDLQRVFRPRWRVRRWRVKDVAQALYSCPTGTTERTDFMRFLHAYFGVGRLGKDRKRFVTSALRKVRRITGHDRDRGARQ